MLVRPRALGNSFCTCLCISAAMASLDIGMYVSHGVITTYI